MRSANWAVLATAAAVTFGLVAAVPTAASAAPTAALVRVDQVGYLRDGVKSAYVMSPRPLTGARFRVLDARGHAVWTGKVGATSLGRWNAAYPDVYPISFDGLHADGVYRVVLTGSAAGKSPAFRVGDAGRLFAPLVADATSFFQVQRDGAHVVPGALDRQPAHLNDKHATVYATPHFVSDDDDTITDATLTAIGGPVDVAGGWFDAGDYLKITHTTAYGDAMLYASLRALGSQAPSGLAAEARFGADWLDKMWDQRTKTLYIQVGIGSGNDAGTFTGDHDLWREPQADDGDRDPADRYAAAHRPVFAAAAPGAKVSPNLAGRVAAAFALAAQVDAATDPARARAEYAAATSLYADADTASPPDPLVTALPESFYPEGTWRDDMEFGAAEIALAAQRLHRDALPYLRAGAHWAASYLGTETGDTLNLYDTSALAHADLIAAMRAAGAHGLAVTPAELATDLRRQLDGAVARATADIFHAGADYDDFDVDSHTFGLVATAALYQRATGDGSYAAFAARQRDWVFGANAWGASFMVGAGTNYPTCMQHQVSNLGHGSAVGAVVNGPNGVAQFEDGLGGRQDGMVKCPAGADPYSVFTGHGSRYVDDVRAWQTVEPALDMTGSAILGLALQEG